MYVEGADLSKCVIWFSPSTGKTSTVLAAARQIFGDMFQPTASASQPDERLCPLLKIIILEDNF